MRSVVLVGLMGSGKSSVGKCLAGLLGVPFVDSDSEIEIAAGMSIPEIFATMGEASFRAGERRVIARLLDERPKVIATGGGAFLDGETRAAIRRQATSIWLRADLEELWRRVRSKPGRPLLNVPDPYATLADLHHRRCPIYAEADIIVETDRCSSPTTAAQEALTAIRARSVAL